jgi:FkbM family methyltransferase
MHVKIFLPGTTGVVDVNANLAPADFITQLVDPILSHIPESQHDQLIRIELPQIRNPLNIRAHTTDAGAFVQIFFHEEYDIPLKVRAPKLIVDGGANVGYTSVYFANRFPDARIIAIEPEASNFEVLKENTSSYKNIELIRGAIWNEVTELRIANVPPRHANYGSNKWGFMVDTPRGGGLFSRLPKRLGSPRKDDASNKHDLVTAVTLGDVLRKSGCDRIDILKLDIEGAEKEVFSTNYADWIDKMDSLLIELHDNQKKGCSAAVYAALGKRKYTQSLKGDVTVFQFDRPTA